MPSSLILHPALNNLGFRLQRVKPDSLRPPTKELHEFVLRINSEARLIPSSLERRSHHRCAAQARWQCLQVRLSTAGLA